MKRWMEKPWFNHAIVACIAVVLYVVLTHFSSLWRAVSTFFGYFTPVILGCVIAYIINPLSKLYYRSVFKRIKKEKRRTVLSNILAFFTVILILVLLVLLLIPQLIESVRTFVMNLEGYVESFSAFLERIGLSASMLDLDSFVDSSESILNTVIDFVKNNGYFEQRRNNQNLYWLRETIDQAIRSRFYNNQRVIAAMEKAEEDVRSARQTSFRAAEDVLETYFNSELKS